MSSFDERIDALTQRMIDEAIVNTRQTLEAGQLQSHADYKYHAGVIAGLRRAKDFLAQALIDVQKG